MINIKSNVWDDLDEFKKLLIAANDDKKVRYQGFSCKPKLSGQFSNEQLKDISSFKIAQESEKRGVAHCTFGYFFWEKYSVEYLFEKKEIIFTRKNPHKLEKLTIEIKRSCMENMQNAEDLNYANKIWFEKNQDNKEEGHWPSFL